MFTLFRLNCKKPRLAGVFFARSTLLRLCLGVLIAHLLLGCQTQVRDRARGSAVPASIMAPPNENSANAIAFRAFSLVGRPYVYGAERPEIGFDCSGFVRYLYRDTLGLELPRTAAAQSASGARVATLAQLRVGDLVFFEQDQRIFHVGLYVGEGRFVHAPRTGKNVALSTLQSGYWQQRFAHGQRLL